MGPTKNNGDCDHPAMTSTVPIRTYRTANCIPRKNRRCLGAVTRTLSKKGKREIQDTRIYPSRIKLKLARWFSFSKLWMNNNPMNNNMYQISPSIIYELWIINTQHIIKQQTIPFEQHMELPKGPVLGGASTAGPCYVLRCPQSTGRSAVEVLGWRRTLRTFRWCFYMCF